MMRKLLGEDKLHREEKQLHQEGVFGTLREENERLQQRLERMEKEQHNKKVHEEGQGCWQEGRIEEPRPHERKGTQSAGCREERRQEHQREFSCREERDETSRLVDDSCGQFPFTDEILATQLLPPN